MANVHIILQTPAFTPSHRHRKTTTATATTIVASTTKIRLSDATIGITIIIREN